MTTTTKASATPTKTTATKPKSTATVAQPATVVPRPVPKATRNLASAFAALGDARTLQVLGSFSNGLPTTAAGLASALGLDTDTVTAAIASLKRQGWVEGSRVEGSRGYSYRITESGSAAWGKAQGFATA